MSDIRKEHNQEAGNRSTLFRSSDLQKATKLSWLEKAALWFVKKQYQVDEIEQHALVYKIFRGRLYIIDHWISPPNGWNCRCQITSK